MICKPVCINRIAKADYGYITPEGDISYV